MTSLTWERHKGVRVGLFLCCSLMVCKIITTRTLPILKEKSEVIFPFPHYILECQTQEHTSSIMMIEIDLQIGRK